MTNSDIVDAFKKQVTHASGKVISKRFSKVYLNKVIPEVISLIEERTSFLPQEFDLRERVFFLEHGITEVTHCIVCGNLVHPKKSGGWDNAKITDVCSNICWNKHPNKSALCKEAFRKVDTEAAKVKRAATMIAKFGVPYTLQREDQKEKLRARYSTKNPYAFKKLSDSEWIDFEYNNKKRFLIDIADELECSFSTVGAWVERHGFVVRRNSATSLVEVKCREFVESLGVSVIPNTRTVLPSKMELDIYIPTHNFAIEVNGIFWHSQEHHKKSEKNYHLNKTLEANAMGITLLHFWCSELIHKENIVRSIISAKLGISTRIFARKCLIKEIDPHVARKFLDDNHLSGFSGAMVHIGLLYNGQLVHVTSIGKPRNSHSKYTYEVIRSASIINHTVVGGFSKCLAHFTRQYCDSGDTIMSYADRRYATGKSYLTVGFDQIPSSAPGYWWIGDKVIYNRQSFMKKDLHRKLENFDPTKTEDENMFQNKYRKLWDCGNLKFVYTVK